MKLRNKQTGEVGKIVAYDASKGIFAIRGKYKTKYYYTLAEVYAEWEDYEPPMPKIENEVVRKIIREWAEVCGVKEVEFYRYGEESDFVARTYTEASISFNFPLELEERRTYTIPDLCGEEEE